MYQKNKINYIPLLTLGIIHLFFLWLIIRPIAGWYALLGVIPMLGYKTLPIKFTKFNFLELYISITSFGLGISLTIWIIIKLETSTVFAAALIGTLASFIPNDVFGLKPNTIQKITHGKLAIYAGTFAGMTGVQYLTNFSSIIYIAIIGGIIYNFLQNSFTGLGGKLGSIGFGATIIYISIKHFLS
tara:strand:- start:7972 stop:8529 length:558 start_codon:yes stop_codon:yes gene_type:complete